MKALLAVLPIEKGHYGVQTDAALARCASITSKANYALPPLGLMYIGSLLRSRSDCSVDLVDCVVSRMGEERFLGYLKETIPDLLLFATGTSTLEYDCGLLQKAKLFLPRLRLVAVGAHVSYLAEDVLTQSCIDYAVRGEPELTVAELVEVMNSSKDLGAILGLAYKEGGSVRVNPPRRLLDDIDSLPFPARDLTARYGYSIPFARTDNFTIMITSRGCPYPCVFCATRLYNGNKCRMRSAANVVAEIEQIENRYGIRDVGFWDDTFTLKRSRVMDICNLMLEKRIDAGWICLSRVDTVDGELLRLMKRAGCYQIQYGVESGAQAILDGLKKGITVEQAVKAFDETRMCGIETAAFFMLGCPAETVDSMEKTISLAKRLKADYASFNIATPYPGTELYQKERDRITVGWRGFDAFHPSSEGTLPHKIIEKHLRKAYLRFYFRPAYILRRLCRRGGLGRIWRDIRVACGLLSKFGRPVA